MRYPSKFIPYNQINLVPNSLHKTKDVITFLSLNDTMVSLFSGITKIKTLQEICNKALPIMFKSCKVINFISGELILSIPNAALCSKLKQYLPKLQKFLLHNGWKINFIRIKIQPIENYFSPTYHELSLPTLAILAFSKLNDRLEDIPSNKALKTALINIIRQRSNHKR